MKRLKSALKYFASFFLVLLVSLCIYTFVITDILKKDYVNVFGYTYFVVATGSMSGTIEVDDIIFVKLTKDVKNNDVITFKSNDGDIITHRLIGQKDDKYITKGDVNNVTDELITKNQIIGKVNLIVSPSFILKSIAIFLIVFILLALVNFDNIIKKYILKGEQSATAKPGIAPPNAVPLTASPTVVPGTPVAGVSTPAMNPNVPALVQAVPDTIFKNPTVQAKEQSSGLTVTIAIDEMEALEKMHVKEEAEVVNTSSTALNYADQSLQEEYEDQNQKELVDVILSILKCKKNNISKVRMTLKWLEKYQYVYRLCHLLLRNNMEQLKKDIINPPFKEIYDYDLERVGLTEAIRNRIYDMPIYIFLRILTYSILYNDAEMFDGIYKILKYKVIIDKYNQFLQFDESDKKTVKQVKSLISFMNKVSNRFDNKNVFELEKIERLAKIGKY
ncbi:MAG: signal peptidase I [Bacilli bacterium]|nr:signal peptidase I [Bacilli bacterium]